MKKIYSFEKKPALIVSGSVVMILGLALILAESPAFTGANQTQEDTHVDRVEIQSGIPEENETVVNEGTPHEYVVEKKTEPERIPDLSTSTIKAMSDSPVSPGEEVRFQITLTNTGNRTITGLDVFGEIGPGFEAPENVLFQNCGEKWANGSDENIQLFGVAVEENKKCVIRYQTKVKKNIPEEFLFSQLYLSSGAEGGKEIGPISSPLLTLAKKKDETDQINQTEK